MEKGREREERPPRFAGDEFSQSGKRRRRGKSGEEVSVCPSDGDSVDHTLVLATSGQQASKPSSAFKTPPFAVVARGGRERELQLPDCPSVDRGLRPRLTATACERVCGGGCVLEHVLGREGVWRVVT